MFQMSIFGVKLSWSQPRESRKKEIIKINIRINETENKHAWLNKAKSWFYEKPNGHDIPANMHERGEKSTNKQYQKWKRNIPVEIAEIKRQ